MAEINEILYQYSKGVNKSTIARAVGASRNTVKSVIKQAMQLGLRVGDKVDAVDNVAIIITQNRYQPKPTTTEQKLSPINDQIEQWLAEKHMTKTQMCRLLMEQGINVSETSLRRYIHRHFPSTPQATMRLTTIPGEQAQVDFGDVGKLYDPVQDKYRRAYAFIMVLSHSRHQYVEFVFGQDSKTWLQCHINAFEFFDGVPRTVVLDNLKSGVITPDVYDPVINKAYSECAKHYGFVVDPTKVRTPEHKGKVERRVTIVRQQIIAGRVHKDIKAANAYARDWCVSQIGQRVVRTTGKAPMAVFQSEEKTSLGALPAKQLDIADWQQAKVHKDCHIVCKGNFYSVPFGYISQTVSVRIGMKSVSIYANNILIKIHPVKTGVGNWSTDNNDYAKNAQYFINQTPSASLTKAISIGEATHAVIKAVLDEGSTRSLRKSWAILKLSEKYGVTRLEQACMRAYACNNYEHKSIARILEKGLEAEPLEEHAPDYATNKAEGYVRGNEEFVMEDHDG